MVIAVCLPGTDQQLLYEGAITISNFIFSSISLMFWGGYFYPSGKIERGFKKKKNPGDIPNLPTGFFEFLSLSDIIRILF